MTEEEIATTRRRLEAQGGIPGKAPSRARYVSADVLLEPETLQALNELAKAEGRSRNDLIREAIRQTWLKKKRR